MSDKKLFNKAVEVVYEQQKASTALLQRELQIPYEKARELIDSMETEGLIGEQDGSGPRDIYISKDMIGTRLSDIANDSNYDKEASSVSKAAVFTFIGTFIYEAFFTDASSGLVFGAVFLFVGMFVASIGISMPFFILIKRFPSFTLVLDILSFVVIIGVTHLAFQGLFG